MKTCKILHLNEEGKKAIIPPYYEAAYTADKGHCYCVSSQSSFSVNKVVFLCFFKSA